MIARILNSLGHNLILIEALLEHEKVMDNSML